MITPIITEAEADAILSGYPDWLALASGEKDAHIYNASLYIQTQWTCANVDWTDTVSIPDEIKDACAFYALADSVGNLFGDPAVADTRRTVREMVKAGSVTVDETFATAGTVESGASASFSRPDLLMSLHCTKTPGGLGGGSTLIRV